MAGLWVYEVVDVATTETTRAAQATGSARATTRTTVSFPWIVEASESGGAADCRSHFIGR